VEGEVGSRLTMFQQHYALLLLWRFPLRCVQCWSQCGHVGSIGETYGYRVVVLGRRRDEFQAQDVVWQSMPLSSRGISIYRLGQALVTVSIPSICFQWTLRVAMGCDKMRRMARACNVGNGIGE
jgi:hypothetical protein